MLLAAAGAEPAPAWFINFVNSTVAFATVTTALLLILTMFGRWLTKADHETMSAVDWAFGVEFLVGAAVSVPSAVAFRVAKAVADGGVAQDTSPSESITYGVLILCGLIILMTAFARSEGRRRAQLYLEATEGTAPSNRELLVSVVIPDLAGIFAVALVLTFSSLGGPLVA